MYYSFLASLLDTDCRNVIVVGGNHDSGDMLDATKEVFDALNIHVIGKIGERTIPDLVFELPGKDGECIALCAAIPYLRESVLRKYYEASYERAGQEVPSGSEWDTDEAKFKVPEHLLLGAFPDNHSFCKHGSVPTYTQRGFSWSCTPRVFPTTTCATPG